MKYNTFTEDHVNDNTCTLTVKFLLENKLIYAEETVLLSEWNTKEGKKQAYKKLFDSVLKQIKRA